MPDTPACPDCGKVHDEGPRIIICDMVERERRVRRRCPMHKVLHYGLMKFYYDDVRIFFDCGTGASLGEGVYWPPICEDPWCGYTAKGKVRGKRYCGIHLRPAKRAGQRIEAA